MNVNEIITTAAYNAGIVSSFNAVVPDDIRSNAIGLLQQVLDNINCDQTLDVNTIVRRYQPVGESIQLTTNGIFAHAWSDVRAEYGQRKAQYQRNIRTFNTSVAAPSADWYTSINEFVSYGTNLQLAYTQQPYSGPPHLWHDFFSSATNNYQHSYELTDAIGIWSEPDTAWYLFQLDPKALPYPYTAGITKYRGSNIEFMPMRIEAVMDTTNNIPYEYTYLSEFLNIDYRWNPFNYAIETHPWGLELIFRNNTPKNVVIPVPLRIENGVIVGQPKFKMYIIDALAARLAVNYQVGTVDAMGAAEERSYNMLKKNVAQPIRPINRRLQQREILRQGQSKYWRFDGYI